MRYRNAPAAIEWLCQVFGFEKHAVYANPEGGIAHAELSFGNGIIMLGSIVDSEFSRLIKQPDEIGGAETQSTYVIVSDADAVYFDGQSGRGRDCDRHKRRELRRPRLHVPRP